MWFRNDTIRTRQHNPLTRTALSSSNFNLDYFSFPGKSKLIFEIWLIYRLFSFSKSIILFLSRLTSTSELLLRDNLDVLDLLSQFILLKLTKLRRDWAILSAMMFLASRWLSCKNVSNYFLLAARKAGLLKFICRLCVLVIPWKKYTSRFTIVNRPISS